MSTLGRALALVAVLACVVTGCGDDDEPATGSSSETTETSEEPTDVQATAEDAADAGTPAPCDLADEADVAAAFGEPVPVGGVGGGGHDQGGVVWQSDNCSWQQDDALEVTLSLATAADFEGGELLCPELSYLGTPSTPVTNLGEEAYWVGDDFNEVEGTVRICTDELLIDIEADAPTGSRDVETLRDQTVALGRVVLGNLG